MENIRRTIISCATIPYFLMHQACVRPFRFQASKMVGTEAHRHLMTVEAGVAAGPFSLCDVFECELVEDLIT